MKTVLKLLFACMAFCMVGCTPQNPPVNPDDELPAFLSKDKKSEMVVMLGIMPVSNDTTIVLNTTQYDKFDELDFFEFKGTVENVEGFRVSVKRSSANMNDQFCAGTCWSGNQQLTQDFDVTLTDATSSGYYAHFYPTASQKAEQIAYTFLNHDRSVTITVKFEYNK